MNSTNQRNRQFPIVLTAIIVAVAVAIAWVVVLGIGQQLITGLLGPDRSPIEMLHIKLDGTPLVVSRSMDNYSGGRTTYRTLEGEQVELGDDETSLNAQQLSSRPRETVLIADPINWGERLTSSTDYGNPRIFWFTVRDDSREGFVYFVGYDSTTKLPIGFLDRTGFHETPPLPENMFHLQGFVYTYGTWIAGNGRWESPSFYPQFLYGLNKEASPAPWFTFILDEGRIWQIDLRKRTIESFAESDDAISMNFVREPVHTRPVEQPENGKVIEPAEAKTETQRKTVTRLAVRHADRIEVWNATSKKKVVYPLPERLRNLDSLACISLGNEQLLVHIGRGYWERGSKTELVWLDTTGKEVRTEQIELVLCHS